MVTPTDRGMSLVEVIIAMSVGAVVILALSLLVINSLKNTKHSQTQTLATKYASDGLEKIRTLRDRDGVVNFDYATNSCTGVAGVADNFSDLWCIHMSGNCSSGLCYFKLLSNSSLQKATVFEYEELPEGLKRQIIIEDNLTADRFKSEKKVTVKVIWTDTSGAHESNLQTLLVNK